MSSRPMKDANAPNVEDLLDIRPMPPDTLSDAESFWSGHQKWLEESGYMLRPRYRPGWVPSWQGTSKISFFCEDGQPGHFGPVMDATRTKDNKFVLLKSIEKSVHPYEVDIGSFLSSEPLSNDCKNHCVPIYDVLQVPDDEDVVIIVMPLLRSYNDPRFDTVGEAVGFFSQMFEGLQFMHKHHIAHRDCMQLNVMMDAAPLYPIPYHPRDTTMRRDFKGRARHLTRTRRPVKYYLIDFGISRRYEADVVPLEDPIWGGDKTVPEFHASNEPCNPFPTDVYYLGNLIRRDFTKGSDLSKGTYGFEFMNALVDDMTQEDPAKRPTMDEVVARFEEIRKGLSSWKLRSRVVMRDDHPVFGFFRFFAHWARRIEFILRRVPAVPAPS